MIKRWGLVGARLVRDYDTRHKIKEQPLRQTKDHFKKHMVAQMHKKIDVGLGQFCGGKIMDPMDLSCSGWLSAF